MVMNEKDKIDFENVKLAIFVKKHSLLMIKSVEIMIIKLVNIVELPIINVIYFIKSHNIYRLFFIIFLAMMLICSLRTWRRHRED